MMAVRIILLGKNKPKTSPLSLFTASILDFFSSWYVGLSPLPVRVTTRIITFLVGNPYKPSFPLLLGGGTTQLICFIGKIPAWSCNFGCAPESLRVCRWNEVVTHHPTRGSELVHHNFGGLRFSGLHTRWWFQIFFIFTPTWGNDPIWLIFFTWVETTN